MGRSNEPCQLAQSAANCTGHHSSKRSKTESKRRGTYRGGSFVDRGPQGCAGQLTVFASEDEAHRRGPEHGQALQGHSPSYEPGDGSRAPGYCGDQYTETIDRRSTLAMLSLFAETFPSFPQPPVECNAAGCKLGQVIVVGGTAGSQGQRSTVATAGSFVAGALLGMVALKLCGSKL